MTLAKSLITIASESAEIEKALIECDGELTEDLEKRLEVKDLELPQKVDNYIHIIKRLELSREHYASLAKELANIAKSHDLAEKHLKEKIKLAAEIMGTDELKGNQYRFKIQRAQGSVIIEDESKIPGDFQIIEQITKIDKKGIAEKLKRGESVEGAQLEPSISLRIYPTQP